MGSLTPKSERREVLLNAGVSEAFLDALDSPAEYEYFDTQYQAPDDAYYYLKPERIAEYDVLREHTITPVCQAYHLYYLLLTNAEGKARFVKFELSADRLYEDYGRQFKALLIDLMIDYYDQAHVQDEDISVETLATYVESFGIIDGQKLLDEIQTATENDLRAGFLEDQQWRRNVRDKADH